jgi:hypothetical protein
VLDEVLTDHPLLKINSIKFFHLISPRSGQLPLEGKP